MQNHIQPLIHDSRFVCIDQQGNRREAWLRGIDGGQDYWTLAENFIVARRAGHVNCEHVSLVLNLAFMAFWQRRATILCLMMILGNVERRFSCQFLPNTRS
jgi:hypothetical protein